jgi:hypothetical protein
MFNDLYFPNSVYFTQADAVQNNTECFSMVNVNNSAYNFQLNKLKHGCGLDVVESGNFTRNVERSPTVSVGTHL